MKALHSKALATVMGALTMVALGASGAVAAPAAAAAAASAPQFGVRYYSEEGAQCGDVQGDQWAERGQWTTPIRLDSDNQTGGCQLAFGLQDPGRVLTGLKFTYKWQVTPGGDSWQCGREWKNPDGTAADPALGVQYTLKPAPFPAFGPNVRVDADGRRGWCNLTFSLEGRDDVALDVKYLYDDANEKGQCINWTPDNMYHTVSVYTPPVTLGVDTDNRPGGCTLQFRLETF